LNRDNPRQEIEDAISAGNLPGLLEITGLLHGHFCPGSAMEEVVAIVETNACFSDGVQMVTGCSFGNNALIYRDYGKTVVTLAKRTGEGVRIAALFERVMKERTPEAADLWEKVVVKRSGSEAESRRLNELWKELSFRVLDIPDEEVLDIKTVNIDVPSYARIFASVNCSVCGESIMEPRARVKDGKPVCLGCSEHDYYQLTGDGLSLVARR
jgi:formylmethanofuran dehydrogenase subunit E